MHTCNFSFNFIIMFAHLKVWFCSILGNIDSVSVFFFASCVTICNCVLWFEVLFLTSGDVTPCPLDHNPRYLRKVGVGFVELCMHGLFKARKRLGNKPKCAPVFTVGRKRQTRKYGKRAANYFGTSAAVLSESFVFRHWLCDSFGDVLLYFNSLFRYGNCFGVKWSSVPTGGN